MHNSIYSLNSFVPTVPFGHVAVDVFSFFDEKIVRNSTLIIEKLLPIKKRRKIL